ncbi:hypothetical protein CR513_58867, partial [Mucuna pruriens]
MDHILAWVPIDNGSSLNIMPKSTLDQLPYDRAHMKTNSTIMRAFEGLRREVMGEIEISVQIQPFSFQIIHSASVVPSSIHQKLKFVVGNKLMIVSSEEDMLVIINTAYMEVRPKEAISTSAMIIVAMIMLGEGYKLRQGLAKI